MFFTTTLSVMAISARMITSVPADQREQFASRAAAEGLSVSQLLARLVRRANAEDLSVRLERLPAEASSDKTPAQKYTVRLMGIDAANLEERAQVRRMTPSGYVAQVLRAHLRANPPMPYREFQQLKQGVNELTAIRGVLQQLVTEPSLVAGLDASVRENILRLLPALKGIRDQVQACLVVNSKSWEIPSA